MAERMNVLRSAVILAGGMGTRLGDLAKTTPKPLIGVYGQPFLYWQLQHLKKVGVTEVLLLVGHMAEKIRDYFATAPISGIALKISTEPEPLGTGGALRHSLAILPEEFFLLNGDSYLPIDLQKLPVRSEATMTVVPVGTVPDVLGNVRLDGSLVSQYAKSGALDFTHIDAGVYRLKKSGVAAGLASQPETKFDLGLLWPKLIVKNRLEAFVTDQRYFDIGTPERLSAFENYLKQVIPS
jgi:NDP-sugar pyrophosphorylase family protein